MTIFDVDIATLTGRPADLDRYRGKVVLVVNVASRCGLTPQYAGLQALHDTYAERGLVVLGVPCNQFAGQEPGSAGEIEEFCQVNYGVTFPITEKVEVNGDGAHPLFRSLTATPDLDGKDGDVAWNFEKWLLSPDGEPVARFRPRTEPDDAAITAALDGLTAG